MISTLGCKFTAKCAKGHGAAPVPPIVQPSCGLVQAVYADRSGGIMPEADHERWLTYAEAGQLLGISGAAARMLAKRRGWPRRTPNMHGDRARVLVPDGADVQSRAASIAVHTAHVITSDQGSPNGPDQVNVRVIEQAITALREALTAERARVDELLHQLAEKGSETDPLPTIGIQTLSQTVEMLREDLAIANSSLFSEHERAETERQDARRRIDELQRRIDGLHTDLADARTAAMISGSEAAALRSRIDEIVTDQRTHPWWRRWFR